MPLAVLSASAAARRTLGCTVAEFCWFLLIFCVGRQHPYPSVEELSKTDPTPDYLEGFCVPPSSRMAAEASRHFEL